MSSRPTVVVDQTFPAVLRALRRERGLSQRELGRLSAYTHTYIWELEAGRKKPVPETAAALDRALGAGGQLAALVTTLTTDSPAPAATVAPETGAGWGDMLRRTMLLGPAAAVVSEVLGACLPIIDPPGRRGNLSPATVVGLAEVSAHYRRAYHAVPSSRLLSAALAHLDLVMSLRPAGRPEAQRTMLLTTAGEMAALAGVLLGLDAGQCSPALAYLDLAWAVARAADDRELQAVVLGCRSFALASDGDHRSGLECVDFARDLAASAASAETRGWVAAVASERCASLGDVAGCQRRLDASREALASQDASSWRGIGGFSVDKLRAYEGGDMVRLGRYADAQVILDEALAGLDDSQQCHRATALIDRAEAHMGSGDVDTACADAGTALELVTVVQHAGNFSRIEALAGRGAQTGARSARTLHRDVQLARADHGLSTRWGTA
jgi:transcriptional regulator with XRE-family HTH domain